MFIDKDSLIKKYNIIIKRLLIPKLLYFTNRLPSSFITYYFIAKMTIGHYIKFILFYVNVFHKQVDYISELTTSKTHQKLENSYFNILTTTS